MHTRNMNGLQYQNNIQVKTGGILLLLTFLAMTDFAVFISYPLSTSILAIIVLGITLLSKKNYKTKPIILIFTLTILFLTSINLGEINGLLFIPIISHILHFSLKIKANYHQKIIFGFKYITYFIFFTCLIEISIKLNLIDLSLYSSFINDYGDGRFDVLRTRSLYGSSLSTAAFSIIIFFFWSHIKPNWLLSGTAFLIAILSGSRTSFILCGFIFLLSPLLTEYFLENKIKNTIKIILIFLFSSIALFYMELEDNNRLSYILLRAFDITIDDSLLGRADTTLTTLNMAIDGLPLTIFTGLKEDYITDSALVAIAAKSGFFAAVSFFLITLLLILGSKIPTQSKITIISVLLIGSAMIGDMFIPSVSFLLFTMIFSCEFKKP